MALATFVCEGSAIDYTPSSDVAAGDVVVQADTIGVARTPIPANTPGSLAVTGVFDFPKATGTGSGIVAGAEVYWDVADKQAKTDSESGANKLLGKAIQSASDTDAIVRVRLNQ
jgi:predicted RecA/RadA family phage recombinase